MPPLPIMLVYVHRYMPIIKTEKIPHQVIAGYREALPGAHGVDRLPCHAKACVDQSHSRLAPERALRYPAFVLVVIFFAIINSSGIHRSIS